MINIKIESSEVKIAIGKAIINAIMKTSSPLEASSLEELGENYLAIVNDNKKKEPSFSTDLLFDVFKKNIVSEEERKYANAAYMVAKTESQHPIGTYDHDIYKDTTFKELTKNTRIHKFKTIENAIDVITKELKKAYSYVNDLESQAFILPQAVANLDSEVGNKLMAEYNDAIKLISLNMQASIKKLEEIVNISVQKLELLDKSCMHAKSKKDDMQSIAANKEWHAPTDFKFYKPNFGEVYKNINVTEESKEEIEGIRNQMTI